MKIAPIEVKCLGHYGSDLDVVNAARVSMHKESKWELNAVRTVTGELGTYPIFDQELSEKDEKLIKYLAEHKHFSPFNHCFLSFRVKAPIFVSRQLVKHKFLPWNEVSRRYVETDIEFYDPKHWRPKAENVKQGSGEGSVDILVYHGTDGKNGCDDPFMDTVEIALESYYTLLAKGVCPEQARMVLPQNMMTEFVWSGTLGAWLDMLVLRLDPHTQQETRTVAQLIATEVSSRFPVSYDARINTK